ncbi:MAG: LysM peptidoglycan-binding domain-containing protein [Pseudomonadota bacterium]
MKKLFMTSAATILALGGGAAAEDNAQAPDRPAATALAPTPTIQEDIVYLRDVIAVQTLRLDEAEQNLVRQGKLIELQEEKISILEAELNAARATLGERAVSLDDAALRRVDAEVRGKDVHVVKSGDTLYSIARSMGVSVDRLASTNNIREASQIEVGQVIRNPVAPPRIASAPQAPPKSTSPRPTSPRSPTAPTQPTKPAAETRPVQRFAANTTPPAPGPQDDPAIQDRAINQQRKREEPDSSLPTEVGVRPEEDREAPYLALFSDIAGILTPKGSLFVEPALTVTASSDNRFFFEGVEIIDAILIGAIEATDTDRIAITESLGLRYGLSNRLEVDVALPYVYREDRVSGVAIDDRTEVDDARFGAGLGDVSLGLHYQLNEGKKWPYLIANLRAKAPTGNGPFDVERTPGGLETELATGSGFWSVEPTLSFILPSDPAVIFGNFGYQKNFAVSPNELIGDTTVQEFRPGDAIVGSLGVGLSLNPRLSMNLGYDHRYFLETETITEGLDAAGNLIVLRSRQSPTTVSSFLFGGSYAINDRVRFNLNSSFGATDEAPDFRVSGRLQIRLAD